ncbi:MAG: hypothetical protein A2V67_01280 [Deltaproteobacteria bacterium RBG_13_61_14]|nr:MAG: hypothetical protein A2V67_01280 [Deltaproteobacteria bacterium RBG_13_61_14]
MKVGVTGAAGFVGKHLVERLIKDGHEVAVTDHPRCCFDDFKALGARAFPVDLCERAGLEECFRGAEVVFHVAAFASPWGRREKFWAVNVRGTENVIQACRLAGVRRLVAVSSTAAVFDGYTHHVQADESLPYPTKFLSPYGETKSVAEQRVLAANGPDLETVALRPHLIWGPRDRTFLARLLMHARSGPIYHVGGGATETDTTYVDNLVDGLLLAAQSERAPGRAYFITNGEPVRYGEFISRFLDILEMPQPRGSIPTSLAYGVGAVFEAVWKVFGLKQEPMLTRYKVAELACTHTYKIDRARQDLGYHPRVSNEEGFARLAAWVQEVGVGSC